MIKNMTYYINKKFINIESFGFDKTDTFEEHGFQIIKDNLVFYEDEEGNWLFKTTDSNNSYKNYFCLYYKNITDVMRDHCFIDEDDVIRELKKTEDQISFLESKKEELLYEAGLQDIDLTEEYLKV